METNGKNIKCKFCGEEFYISFSRFNTKKYCSRECAKQDDYGFKEKTKNCQWCQETFLIKSSLRTQDKYCGDDCAKQAFKEKQEERYEKLRNEPVIGKCKNCLKEFEYSKLFSRTYCSKKCQSEMYSKARKGKNNPAYRNGLYLGQSTGKYAGLHLRMCAKYRKAFLEKNSYLYCEVCGVNANGTPRFEVHHIYFASRVPKHPELHNFRNLILVCIQCHNNFHSSKNKEEFERIEEERGLKELFKGYV